MHESPLSTSEKSAALLEAESGLRETIAELENEADAGDELACALNDLADCLVELGRCDGEILALYQRALDLFTQSSGIEQTDAANVLNNLAAVHYDSGDYPKA